MSNRAGTGTWLSVGGVAASAVAIGGAVALLAWLIFRTPMPLPSAAALRLLAFTLAVMGLTWLTAVFFVIRPGWLGLIRWAAAVDAAGIGLLIGAMASGTVGWVTGLKLYAVLACFATLQLALAGLTWRLTRSTGPAAIAGLAVMVVACTSLVWGHLPCRLTSGNASARHTAVLVVRYLNPLLAANDALNAGGQGGAGSAGVRFFWPQHGWMYAHYGLIGSDQAPALPDWLFACGIYLLVAGIMAAVMWLLSPRKGETA